MRPKENPNVFFISISLVEDIFSTGDTSSTTEEAPQKSWAALTGDTSSTDNWPEFVANRPVNISLCVWK